MLFSECYLIMMMMKVTSTLMGFPTQMRGFVWSMKERWQQYYAGLYLALFGHLNIQHCVHLSMIFKGRVVRLTVYGWSILRGYIQPAKLTSCHIAAETLYLWFRIYYHIIWSWKHPFLTDRQWRKSEKRKFHIWYKLYFHKLSSD